MSDVGTIDPASRQSCERGAGHRSGPAYAHKGAVPAIVPGRPTYP